MEHGIAHFQVIFRHAVNNSMEIDFLLFIFRQFGLQVLVPFRQSVVLIEQDLRENVAELRS